MPASPIGSYGLYSLVLVSILSWSFSSDSVFLHASGNAQSMVWYGMAWHVMWNNIIADALNWVYIGVQCICRNACFISPI
ncbi:hypothetical protein CC78DRAFT_305834 [Lojkania enalia]|uniref:Uncharacterized protein n=1 Tax=Lojkania enalia TaxID=147567 RepID=A0A9P4N9P4_9PLEO|nr:hypothetical protein CC78DRAFT_305834 [Didymosphaeria enalia]